MCVCCFFTRLNLYAYEIINRYEQRNSQKLAVRYFALVENYNGRPSITASFR